MNKKIWIDIQKINNPYSGLGQFCIHLKKAILQQTEDKNELKFFAGEKKFLLLINKFLFNTLLKIKVWHATHQEASLRYVPFGCALVLTVHDLNFLYKYNGLKRWWKKMRLQLKLKQASHITAISQFTKNELISHFGIKATAISVIYNGANTMLPAVLPTNFPFEANSFILTIGIIQPKKNVMVLLNLLKDNCEKLVIAGDDSYPYAEAIKNASKNAGISDRVFFTGKVNENYKSWLLQNCKAFAFPSLQEGFGLPVLEALSFGKPCFVATMGSLPEVGGKAVFYFTSFDEKQMQKDFQQGMNLYQNDIIDYEATAKQQVAKFDWENAAQKYLALYHQLEKCKYENSI